MAIVERIGSLINSLIRVLQPPRTLSYYFNLFLDIVNGLSLVLFTIAVGFGPLITSKIHFEEYKPLIVALSKLIVVKKFKLGKLNL